IKININTMHIVMGASGRVGSAVVEHLLGKNHTVKAVIRDPKKADSLENKGASIAIADAFNAEALQQAFEDGNTAFVLTPESIHTDDMIGDAQKILANYREVLENSTIKKVVGLSSVGAQFASGTGNLQASYLLEHTFAGLPIQQIFVRPTYYYSNWLSALPTVRQHHLLPTFYPEELSVSMISPREVGTFIAEVMNKAIEGDPIYELEGPYYSSNDIAELLGEQINTSVQAEQIPKDDWREMLRQIGFSTNAATNF